MVGRSWYATSRFRARFGNPFRVGSGFMGTVTQGRRLRRQPWALLRNAFSVVLMGAQRAFPSAFLLHWSQIESQP
jgi:hypothetical protein